jgi:hypothetical protein
MFFVLCRKLEISATASALATLLISLSPVIWRLGITTEVYPLKNVCMLAILLIIWRLGLKQGNKHFGLAGFIFGLMLGVYFGLVLNSPALAILIFFLKPSLDYRVRFIRLLYFGLGSFAGLLFPAFYIYQVAQSNPPIGTLHNPSDLENLIKFLFAIQFESQIPLTASLEALFAVLKHAGVVIAGLGLIGVPYAIYGTPKLLRNHPAISYSLLLMIGIESFYFPLHNSDLELSTFLYICIGFFIAGGIDRSLKHSKHSALFCTSMVCLVATMQYTYFPFLAQIQKPDLETKCSSLVESIPRDSVLFVDWECMTALRVLQTFRSKYLDYEIYEFIKQPRRYRIAGEIKRFTPLEYLKRERTVGKKIFIHAAKRKAQAYCNECTLEPLSNRLFEWKLPQQ